LSKEELDELYQTIEAPTPHLEPIRLQTLLEDSLKTGYSIPTYFQALDNLLEEGIPFGKITELCGQAGSGKTQLWLVYNT
jgi:RecA/RadA recombinase